MSAPPPPEDTRPSMPASLAAAKAVEAVRAVPATPGRWLDTSWRLTPHVLEALVAAGVVGVGRYLPLPGNDSSELGVILDAGFVVGVGRYLPLPGNDSIGDITGLELGAILDAGLQCILVQHCRKPGWIPAKQSGVTDAEAACAAALACGYPSGAHIFLDLEGCVGTPLPAARFCDDWARTVKAAGWLAGLYVGFSALLSPTELYELPDFDTYWRDAAERSVATRGFALKQGKGVVIAGVEFDEDIMAPDALGGLPVVCGV